MEKEKTDLLNFQTLARMYRLADELNLPDTIKHSLESDIQGLLKPNITETIPVWKETAENYELKLRHLMKNDVSWDKIFDTAWKFFTFKPSTETAVRIFEVCFLTGTEQQLLELFQQLNKHNLKFYTYVNKNVRNQLILSCWNRELGDYICSILMINKDYSLLLGVEKLLLYKKLLISNDPLQPYKFFKSHETEIKNNADIFGEQIKFSKSYLTLKSSKIAMELNHPSEARKQLIEIPSSSQEYKEALQLLLKLDQLEKRIEQDEHYLKLIKNDDWMNRLLVFQTFLSDVRNKKIHDNFKLSILNQILLDPLKWFPQNQNAWEQIAKTLSKNFDLAPLLPNITQMHFKNATIFHPRQLDLMLWQSLSHEDTPNFWRSIALVHQYVANYGKNDVTLWKAKKIFHQQNSSIQLWDQLIQAIRLWTNQTKIVSNDDKEIIYSHLSLLDDQIFVSTEVIHNYLTKNKQIPYDVLIELNQLCIEKNLNKPRVEIIQRIAKFRTITNTEYKELWNISIQENLHDLSWRICSILHSRQVLSEKAQFAWQISGENRKSYNLIIPTSSDISLCTKDMSDDEKKLCFSILWAGSTLPLILETHTEQQIEANTHLGTRVDDIESHLDQLLWCQTEKKRRLFKYSNTKINLSIPIFAQTMPSHEWALLLSAVISRLGFNTWNWILSNLCEALQLKGMALQKFNTVKLQRSDIGSLLKKFTPIQQKAITELKTMSKKIEDERAAFVLATFFCRLATVMFQYNYQALISLQEMRVPLAILRDLECWMISTEYSQIRKEQNAQSKVPVPSTLLNSDILKN